MTKLMTNHDDDDMFEASRHDEEAYATSTAIVGECVIDSPYPTKSICSERSFSCLTRRSQRCADETILASTSSTVSDTDDHYHHQLQQSSVSTESTCDTVSNNGIVAQGLAWARKQREHRQRMYLQNQAEMQIRKIQLAQEQEEKDALERRNGISLTDNPTFQSFMRMSAFRNSNDIMIAPISSSTSSSNGGLGSVMDVVDSKDENMSRSTLGMIRGYFWSSNTESNGRNRISILSQANHHFKNESIDQQQQSEGPSVTKLIQSECGGYSVEIPVVADKVEEHESWIPPVRIQKNERDMKSSTWVPYIVTSNEMHQIASNVLPPGIVYCPWTRLYSLARDGDSFESCLRYIGNEKQTLIVVRTCDNDIFGGFADTPWNYGCNQNGPQYFGGTSSCIFRIEKKEGQENQKQSTKFNVNTTTTKPESGSRTSSNSSKVICYKWTGVNRYVLLCDTSQKMLAFGGGGAEGAFGLCIENNFQFGSTGACDTFANEPLTTSSLSSSKSQSSFFDIIDMEVYGFLIGQF